MGLHVGMLRAEQAAGALARDVLYFVHPGAAAVIALAGVALGILVRQHAAHCGHHGRRYHVFRGNQFNVPALAAKLTLHGPRHLCIALGHKADGVQHIRVHVHPPYLVVFQLSFFSIQRNAVVHKHRLCYDENGRWPAFLRRFCHMRTKQDTLQIVNRLKEEYPLAECTLDYDSAWQLLVSVRLAAQCTDARVNIVTEELFAKYPTLEALAAAGADNIEAIVRPCGLGRSKARDLAAMSNMLLNEFDGRVPQAMEDLLKLPGVGRKSANLVRGDVFGLPAVVADTHCIRLSNRLGFVKDTKDPVKVEKALVKVLPPEESNDFCHRCVLHGRAVCTARRPYCERCCLAQLCPTGKKALAGTGC